MNSSITETTLNFLIISVTVEIISNLTFISAILEIIMNFDCISNISEKSESVLLSLLYDWCCLLHRWMPCSLCWVLADIDLQFIDLLLNFWILILIVEIDDIGH